MCELRPSDKTGKNKRKRKRKKREEPESMWFLSVELSALNQQEEAMECLVNKQSSLIMYSN